MVDYTAQRTTRKIPGPCKAPHLYIVFEVTFIIIRLDLGNLKLILR